MVRSNRDQTDPTGRDVDWHDCWVPGEAGQQAVRIRCFLPSLAGQGVVVWVHGGSWSAGSIDAWHEPCAALAVACGQAVVSVDYRLAPRWHYPAPVDDVMQVLRWLAGRLHLTQGPTRLIVGGDSAGATLAASAAVRCRDEGLPLAAQVLAYPPLDPTCSLPSYRNNPRAFPTRQVLLDAWLDYRGVEEARYLTPWLIDDLRGLAPALIGVGECDPVLDDCLLFGTRLRQQGNQVLLRMFPGATHGLFFQQRVDGSFPLQDWIARCLNPRHPTTTPIPGYSYGSDER